MCHASLDGYEFLVIAYDYNFFTGTGSMSTGTQDYVMTVTGDQMVLSDEGGTGSELYTRIS
jgi:hypothetical protein